MSYLLDTIVLIWAVRGLHDARRVLDTLRSHGDLAISAITLLELRRALPAEEFACVEPDLEGVEVLPLDAATATAAGTYMARCAEEGHRIDFFAGIIHATAERSGRALITYSPAHYPLATCTIFPLAELVPRPG